MDAKSRSVATEWAESDEPRLSPSRLLGLTRPALRLVWRASPRETINLLVLTSLSGLTMPAQLFAGKWALDGVLILDRTTREQRRNAMRALREAEREREQAA